VKTLTEADGREGDIEPSSAAGDEFAAQNKKNAHTAALIDAEKILPVPENLDLIFF
jgi:hypothetical protein